MDLTKDECAKLYLNSYNFSSHYSETKEITEDALRENIPELSDFYEDLKLLYMSPSDGRTDNDFFDFAREYANGDLKFLDENFDSYFNLKEARSRGLKYPALQSISKNIHPQHSSRYKIYFSMIIKKFIYDEYAYNSERNLTIIRMIELNEFAHKAKPEETLYDFLKRCEDSVAYHCNNLILNNYSSYSYGFFENIKYCTGTIFESISEESKSSDDTGLLQTYYSMKKKEVYGLTTISLPINLGESKINLFKKEPKIYLEYLLRRIMMSPKHRIEFEINEIKHRRREIFRDTERAKDYNDETYSVIIQHPSEMTEIFNSETTLILEILYNSEEYRDLDPYDQSKIHRLLENLKKYSQCKNSFESNILLYRIFKKSNTRILLKLLIEIYNQKESISFVELSNLDASMIEDTPIEWIIDLVKTKKTV